MIHITDNVYTNKDILHDQILIKFLALFLAAAAAAQSLQSCLTL